MPDWRIAFDQRKAEIEVYFRFVEQLVANDAQLSIRAGTKRRRKQVGDDVHRVLKASTFLVLYNFIEASVRAGLEDIFSTLKNDGLTYADVASGLQRIWIDIEFQHLVTSGSTPSSYREKARDIVEFVLQKKVLAIDHTKIPIGGNIDARKIRDLALRVGFSEKTRRSTQGGDQLVTVKDKRNALAHGDITFGECGREYTMQQLREIQKQVVHYIFDVMKNIDKYKQEGRFRAS